MERKLAAILCADVFGYSRLMGEDEEATLRTLSSHRKIIDGLIEQHHGRFVNSAGDSVLAEFASVVNAVQCAVDVQTALKAENADLPAACRMEFRIGVNLGDVMVEGEQIYGDGVNVAARLESLAEPGGICVSRMVYENVRNKLPLSFQDIGNQTVKNITEPVHVWRVLLDGTAPHREARRIRRYWRGGALSLTGLAIIVGTIVLVQNLSLKPPHTHATIPPQEKPALPLPSIPSIAVLPFVNLSGDRSQDYFSDGITDDLVTDLSRLPGLFVIDRSSTFAYKGKVARVQDVGRELGVRYILEGSARKATNRVRVDVQLVDASNGNQVWGQRFDKNLSDIFKLQDEIVHSVIGTLNLQLPLLERGFVIPQRTNNLEAYDYYLRGLEYFLDLSQTSFARSRKLLDKAIELDPNYPDPYFVLALSYFLGDLWEWDSHPTAFHRATALDNRGLALDDSAGGAYALLGWIDALNGESEKAINNGKRAVSLSPNDAFSWMALANIMFWAGRPNETLADAQKALRLDPRHPEGYLAQEGFAFNALGRYSDALTALKAATPNDPDVHMSLVFTYSELGREQEARAEAAELLRLTPQFSLDDLRRRRPMKGPNVQHFLDNMRKAGLK